MRRMLWLGFLPAYGVNPSIEMTTIKEGFLPPGEMTVKLGRISSGFGGIYGESLADWLT